VPGAVSPAIQRPGREPDHCPASDAEIKNAWDYASTPHGPSWYAQLYHYPHLKTEIIALAGGRYFAANESK